MTGCEKHSIQRLEIVRHKSHDCTAAIRNTVGPTSLTSSFIKQKDRKTIERVAEYGKKACKCFWNLKIHVKIHIHCLKFETSNSMLGERATDLLIGVLPPEIFNLIVSFLANHPQSLQRLRSTSKSICIVLTPILFEFFALPRYFFGKKANTTDLLHTTLKNVKRLILNFENEYCRTPSLIFGAVGSLESLEIHSLRYNTGLLRTYAACIPTMPSCSQISRFSIFLYLSDETLDNLSSILSNLPYIKSLKIEFDEVNLQNSDSAFDKLQQAFGSFRYFHSFELVNRSGYRVVDYQSVSIFFKCLLAAPNLSELTVSAIRFPDEKLTALCQLLETGSVQKLGLLNNRTVPVDLYEVITRMPYLNGLKIEALQLSGVMTLFSNHHARTPPMITLKGSLRTLFQNQFYLLDLKRISSFTLTNVDISNWEHAEIMSSFLQALVDSESLSKLEVEVGNEDHFNILNGIVESCPNLRTLSIFVLLEFNQSLVPQMVGLCRTINENPNCKLVNLLLHPLPFALDFNIYSYLLRYNKSIQNLSISVFRFSDISKIVGADANNDSSPLKHVDILLFRKNADWSSKKCIELVRYTHRKWKVRILSTDMMEITRGIKTIVDIWRAGSSWIKGIVFRDDKEIFVKQTVKQYANLKCGLLDGEWWIWHAL